MEEKIKEVQEYFKNKIVNGDYTPVEFSSSYIVVWVDGYPFNLWTGSGSEYFSIWEAGPKYFMLLPQLTKQEQGQAWNAINKHIKANADLIRSKRIVALETELATLKKL